MDVHSAAGNKGSPPRRKGRVLAIFACFFSSCGLPRERVQTAVSQNNLVAAIGEYQTFRDGHGDDLALLADVAILSVWQAVREAEGSAERLRIMRQLRTASARGIRALLVLANASSPIGGLGSDEARWVLAEGGHSESLSEVRSWSDESSATRRAASYAAFRTGDAIQWLVAGLRDPNDDVRRAALEAAEYAAPDEMVATELCTIATADAQAVLRAAAITALADFAPRHLEFVRSRLIDSSSLVRQAAMRTLFDASDSSSLEPMNGALEAPPTSEGVELSALVLRHQSGDQPSWAEVRSRWSAYLENALSVPSPSLRSHAAVVVTTLGCESVWPEILTRQLSAERDHGTAFQLARGILACDADNSEAREALTILTRLDGHMLGLQAAAVLRDEVVVGRALDAESPAVRAAATRILGREFHQAAVLFASLSDRDAEVRLQAALSIIAEAGE